MDKQQFLDHVKHMSPETFVEIYYPIMQAMTDRISSMSQEISDLQLKQEEQDKHYEKLLSRIKTISTE